MRGTPLEAVLLDLDGTLIDTAPDLAAALVAVCEREGTEPPAYRDIRAAVSMGGRGLVALAFAQLDETARQRLLTDFLSEYERTLAVNSVLFGGMQNVLSVLEAAATPWGIVTNKTERLSRELVRQLGLADAVGCVVGGDTLSVSKPRPEPLLHAAEILGIAPERCVYVGDNERDIQAGRAAGMGTIAASWGYILGGDNVERWGADETVHSPHELINLLGFRG